jgi:DNA-binding NarL/FixJ family response regulator
MFNILLVEDNLPFRQLLKENLYNQFPSINVEEAGDGFEAFKNIEVSCPDLVFMDIRLPGENGLEVAKRIKSQCPGIKIIILTSYDLPEYRETAKRYGADSFATKGSSSWEEITTLIRSISKETGKPL